MIPDQAFCIKAPEGPPLEDRFPYYPGPDRYPGPYCRGEALRGPPYPGCSEELHQQNAQRQGSFTGFPAPRGEADGKGLGRGETEGYSD